MKECILICPKWTKNERQLHNFFEGLSIYEGEKVSIVFENNIFEEIIYFKHLIAKYDVVFEKIVFKNVVFKKYVRFNDIQCKELEFLNVSFEKGGGLKNREGKYTLDIGRLIFRPFQVENDFVIDLGNYANTDGFLETEKIGRIREIEFENHKEGNGQIYLIGINQHTELANFRNKILDQISFQNCDLSNCYFLNAKLDKAEFRNCTFPEIRNHMFVNGLSGRREAIYLMLFFPFIVFVLSIMIFGAYALEIEWIFYLYLLILPFYILLILWSFNAFFHPWEYLISFYSEKRKENLINSIKSYHYHYGIADENNINIELKNLRKSNNQDAKFFQDRKKLQASYFNLIELYRQLKENFEKSDFQTAGNFFYAQRYIEMVSATSKKSWMESWVLNIHYMVNGFGERFLRPLILLILTVTLFSAIPLKINKDYIATQNTPKFLLSDHNQTGEYGLWESPYESNQSIYPIVALMPEDETNTTQYILNGEKVDKEISVYISTLKDDWHTRLYYSLTHMMIPFSSENKQWFKEISQEAIFFGYLQSALLWLFSGAFVLAVYHRIKRDSA